MKKLNLIYNDFKEYFKSFFPYRWILVFVTIMLFEILFFILESLSKVFDLTYYIYSIMYVFIIDYTFGLGRSECNGYKNIFGIIVCIIAAMFFYFKMKKLC